MKDWRWLVVRSWYAPMMIASLRRGGSRTMTRTLQSQPQAAILFCRVDPVPHDRQRGLRSRVRDHRQPQAAFGAGHLRWIGHRRGHGGDGVSSSPTMGGFDESFGPGARFPSADEWDIVIRALLTGHEVYETAELTLVHDGFRTFAQGQAHARRDWLALGAVCAKPLRAGHWRAVIIPLWLFSTRAVWPPVRGPARSAQAPRHRPDHRLRAGVRQWLCHAGGKENTALHCAPLKQETSPGRPGACTGLRSQ